MLSRLSEQMHRIYERLFTAYGPQHWWPADSPFEVMVGAILTQSISWTSAEKAILNLKRTGVLSPEALRSLPLAELASGIRPSGYHNVKARKLKALVVWLGSRDDDLAPLRSAATGPLREELLSIYGVGEETADSILLYACGHPVFVIDAYTKRMFSRLGIGPDLNTYADWQSIFMANLPVDAILFNEYHALIVRHGKESCRKIPSCSGCCLVEGCPDARLQAVDALLDVSTGQAGIAR